MRDINRIDDFLTKVGTYWKKHPDLRFGQTMCNLQRYSGNDLFYYEEKQLLSQLEKFEKEMG